MDAFALSLGPRIDELVQVARTAGESRANRRTIRYWVSRGYIHPPHQHARSWRYPHVAIGQAELVARLRAQHVHRDYFRFALFIETSTGKPEEARAFELEYLRLWKAGLTEQRERFATDPHALQKEAANAARKRGKNAPLPHRVRTTLDERTNAMLYALSMLVGAPIPPMEQESGLRALERIAGLRSGRGGASRDLSDISSPTPGLATDPERLLEAIKTASAEHLELARRATELAVAWFPALRSLLGQTQGAEGSVAFVDVIAEWHRKVTPDLYAILFATFVGNGIDSTSETEVRELLTTFKPELIAAFLLSKLPGTEREVALRRLGPYQRLRLSHLFSVSPE